jgi:hypothetical protein
MSLVATTLPVLRPAPAGRSARGRAGGALVFALMGLLQFAATAAAAEPAVSQEYQVKAAFLYNFTKFVEWPATAFPDASSPIVIGIAGDNPFGGELENLVRDRKVNGRPLRVVAVPDLDAAAGVHVIFIPATAERGFEKNIESLTRGGVLVVGETGRFLGLGGTVQFTAEDRVRFEISVAAATRGGLKISAQLQKLALAVRR